MKIALQRVCAFSLFLLSSTVFADTGHAPNSQPDPYRTIRDFFKLPAGRVMGSISAVAVDHKGNIWVADRCGANDCAGSKLAPVMEFDQNGKVLRTLGKPGVVGAGHDTFSEPNAVLIAPDGDIFVADGNEPGPGHRHQNVCGVSA